MNNYPKILVTALVCLFFTLQVSAQRGVTLGDKYAKQFDFISAIEEYKKVIDKDAENIQAIKGLALSYRYTGNFAESERWYGKLVELDSGTPEYRFYYSQALRSTKKYDKALESWKIYKSQVNEAYVSSIIDGFQYIDALLKGDPNVDLKNASGLNTEASDFGIAFKSIGEVVFASTRNKSQGAEDNWTHGKYTDLYYAIVSEDNQSETVKFQDDQFNGMYHDGPAVFYENTMYLTRTQYRKGKLYKAKEDQTAKLEIVQVDLDERSSKLKKFSEDFDFNNKEYSVAHAAISPNGMTIIFSSDSKSFDKNFGGTDLYMITKKGDEWSSPVNLGEIINTPADEEYPFYSAQNEIFFASDGHYGLGGLDIYSARFNGESWSEPQNMGAPFNSSFDDFNYVYSDEAEFGFVSSNRPGGKGSDDIYTFKYTDGKSKSVNSIMLKVLTYDEETLEPLGEVQVDLRKCMEATFLTDIRGTGSVAVDPLSVCKLYASLDGYFPKEMDFTVFEKDVEIAVPLRRVADNTCTLVVCVSDEKTGIPVSKASVKVMSEVEGTSFAGLTGEDGCVTFEGIIGDNFYRVVAGKEVMKPEQKYLSSTGSISTNGIDCPSELQVNLEIGFIQVNTPYVLENIYYDLDKYFIRPDAAVELERLVSLLKANPSIEIELGSHTDCRQTATYNQTLSNNRAKAAVEYIVSRGIDASRLTYKGYGETQLVNNCACEPTNASTCSEEEHQMNRRTEFKITKF